MLSRSYRLWTQFSLLLAGDLHGISEKARELGHPYSEAGSSQSLVPVEQEETSTGWPTCLRSGSLTEPLHCSGTNRSFMQPPPLPVGKALLDQTHFTQLTSLPSFPGGLLCFGQKERGSSLSCASSALSLCYSFFQKPFSPVFSSDGDDHGDHLLSAHFMPDTMPGM